MSATFYPYVGAFIWISILLVGGAFLRNNIPFLQNRLIPSSLIGGVIGFVLLNTGLIGMPTPEGWMTIPPKVFGVMVFHLFAFGFVGIGLLQQDKKVARGKSTWLQNGALWMAFMYCLVYAVQGVTGKSIFEFARMITGGEFFTGFGYLVGSGFSQSPGAAQAFGTIWESTYGVQGASSVGLAFGAMGFLCAICLGIPLANRGIKNGWVADKSSKTLPASLLTGMMGKGEATECTRTTTHPANIDNLAFHLAVMAALYGVGYVFALTWSINMPKGVNGLGFGLLYTWGMIAGLVTRKVLEKIDRLHVLDNATVRGVTSSTIDYMICAVFMGISMSDIQAIIVPFLTTVAVAALVTYILILWFARRMPEYGFERGLAILGCYTGTVASGILLLRIVDPDFKSPAAVELAVMNVFILPLIQLVYLNLPFIPTEGSIMLPIFIAYIVMMPIALFFFKFVQKRAW
ncbi:sodium/glutamate symporter [Desulfoluna spongiiphila]|uniref:Glutamate:Na+ symporter, ESS family n=1 Tax=Desulfoluna spongiiphila TaxID=419481 RepID=A0A1G5B3P7_9BACT|nr:sodium/glutamate symporter [Desulfoluna spongiiphila]SCX84716.1 glutamate:Na+ symporter, ESS family [Desulfoluna spongiiphila]VVS92163.1 sodium/glutamate symport carrier protein glts [Desulfoluna spongiiphila]